MFLFLIPQNTFDDLLDGYSIDAGDGYGIMAVLHDELHGARLQNKMFHLAEVDNESTMIAF